MDIQNASSTTVGPTFQTSKCDSGDMVFPYVGKPDSEGRTLKIQKTVKCLHLAAKQEFTV